MARAADEGDTDGNDPEAPGDVADEVREPGGFDAGLLDEPGSHEGGGPHAHGGEPAAEPVTETVHHGDGPDGGERVAEGLADEATEKVVERLEQVDGVRLL